MGLEVETVVMVVESRGFWMEMVRLGSRLAGLMWRWGWTV